MRWKSTLVLLAVVVALGLFILLYERKTLGTGAAEHKRIFPGLDEEASEKIDRVEIDRPKEGEREKIVIEKLEKDHWEITEPIEYRADRFKASGVVSDLGYADKREIEKGVHAIRAEEGKELALEDYGLDEASAAFIRLYGGEELLCELKVGHKGPGGQNCFVQAMPDEGCVYVSDASLYTDATDDLSAYRDKDVVLVKANEVEKLVVKRPGDLLEFAKKEGVWEMTSPAKDRTKSGDVQLLVNKCTGLRVDEFMKDGATEEDLKGYGLDSPGYRMTLTVKEKGEPTDRQILVGKAPEGKTGEQSRYAMLRGSTTVFTVSFSNISSDLKKEADEFRDSKLILVDPDDANRLVLERGEEKLVFSKLKYDWKIEEPQARAGNADYDAVKKLLEELRDAEIKEYLPPAELLSGITVTAGFKSEKTPEESFTVGRSGAKTLATRKGFDGLFVVAPELIDKLSKDVLHFMSKKIFHVPTTDVVWLRIEKEDKVETAERDAGRWKLAEPTGEIDEDRVKNDIVWPLSDLYAQKLFGEAEEGELERYGLAEPWAKVTFKHKEKVEKDGVEKEELREAVVLFGAETKDGRRYAKLAGSKMVFEASASLAEGVAKGVCKETVGGEEKEGEKEAEAEGEEEAEAEGEEAGQD